MRLIFTGLLLSCVKITLLCSAIIIPPNANLRINQAYQDSVKLLVSMRQPLFCSSQTDCGQGLVCVQPIGEVICEEDCDGFCSPENRIDIICNCEDPCETGVCVNLLVGTEADNGVCLADELAEGVEVIKCPQTDKSPSENGSSSTGDEPSSDDDTPDPVNTPALEEDSPENPDPTSSEDSPENPEPTSSESTTEGVCISADMLDEFESHQLVFPKHVLSHVLCDAFGSCATSGHIVEYEGRGMMMSSYCGIVGCSGKVMYVNSPKYRGGLRVKSRSAGMKFTSFAARYGTRGEEAVLRAVMKMGL